MFVHCRCSIKREMLLSTMRSLLRKTIFISSLIFSFTHMLNSTSTTLTVVQLTTATSTSQSTVSVNITGPAPTLAVNNAQTPAQDQKVYPHQLGSALSVYGFASMARSLRLALSSTDASLLNSTTNPTGTWDSSSVVTQFVVNLNRSRSDI